jgi:cytochrome oxidase assembly protein ShyY1
VHRLLTLRWLAFTLVVLALAGVFVQLGRWQLHRLDDREHRNTVTRANLAAAPAPVTEALGPDRRVARDNEWRIVTATGTYDTAHQVVARYRNVKDRPGFEIVTPLLLPDGTAVLVDRGFVPRATNSSDLPAVPAAATGTVTVTGKLRHSEHGADSATHPVDGQVRLINAPAIAASTGLDLADGYMTVDEQVPAPGAGLSGFPLPELDSGPHFFYALQWFFFALLALGGLVYFAREDVRGGGTEGETADRELRADRGPADRGAGLG